ncbi:MAG TPA: hypothetical protein PKU80_00760 [Candidatus Limiplasma sp.]|nr:hypothetical protein [Candidatus Limiplasma sp.]
MNSFTNTILTLLLGWLRTLLNAARDFFSSDSSTAFFAFFQANWRLLFLVLCIVGFSLDIIVYLVRWRPRPAWRRKRAKRKHAAPPVAPAEPYGFDDWDTLSSPAATTQYAPIPKVPYNEYAAEPTMKYNIPSRQAVPPMNTAPATIPYTTPYYAPEANAYQEQIPQLYTDEPIPDLAQQTIGGRKQSLAFGMPPSFGSAQSEPAYHYPVDNAPTFAPPQYAYGYEPADPAAPPLPAEQVNVGAEVREPQSFVQPSPNFRPFSDRGEADFSPPKARGLGAVAKRARNLLNSDEASDALTYRDFQPTVDVSQAFHSPVYPEKKPEGDA